ncbi:MAG TPA: type II secretion system F family protein [Aquabacterium sp.]|jgi:tight adherence protein B|nr:type II secretion system F family protein [Aquabacterium sp.]
MSAAVAISMALFVWAVFEIGVTGLARYRETFTSQANVKLRELFLFIDPSRLYALNFVLLVFGGCVVWVVTGSFVLVLPVVFVLSLIPRFVLQHMRQSRLDKFEQQLPDALLMLASGMRAGASLTMSTQQLVRESEAPIAQEFELMLREQRLGVALDTALENLLARVPLQSLSLVVAAMRIANETGGGLAEALDRAAQTLRSKMAMEGKIKALTAQGKMQAWVVGMLPLTLIYVLSKMEPEAMEKLWTTPIGYGTLAAIAILEFFGIVLIRKIVAVDV